MNHLERRLLSCFTAGDLALEAFIRIAGVELSDTIPTAAIECRDHPRLLLNTSFIAEHCDTDERLFMLVLHEIHHVLLGHTRLFPRPNVAHFYFGPRAGRAQVSTRIRLFTSQKIIAIATLSDGSFWSGSAEVVITLAACIEE